jgi:hypothetical protein
VAQELGDDDEVGAAAHEGGREGVPQDVCGRVVVEAGGGAAMSGLGPRRPEAAVLDARPALRRKLALTVGVW